MSASVYPDVNTLTGTLKAYLRDLPDKLFTAEASEAWIAAARTCCGSGMHLGSRASGS